MLFVDFDQYLTIVSFDGYDFLFCYVDTNYN